VVSETLERLNGADELSEGDEADLIEWAMMTDAAARRVAAQVLARFAGKA